MVYKHWQFHCSFIERKIVSEYPGYAWMNEYKQSLGCFFYYEFWGYDLEYFDQLIKALE